MKHRKIEGIHSFRGWKRLTCVLISPDHVSMHCFRPAYSFILSFWKLPPLGSLLWSLKSCLPSNFKPRYRRNQETGKLPVISISLAHYETDSDPVSQKITPAKPKACLGRFLWYNHNISHLLQCSPILVSLSASVQHHGHCDQYIQPRMPFIAQQGIAFS